MISEVTHTVDLSGFIHTDVGDGRLPAAEKPPVSQPAFEPGRLARAVSVHTLLEAAVRSIEDARESLPAQLQIEIDADSHRVIVKVMNGKSGDVIRQIPAEEWLSMAKSLADAKGLLLEALA